jgi:hypothetical protein
MIPLQENHAIKVAAEVLVVEAAEFSTLKVVIRSCDIIFASLTAIVQTCPNGELPKALEVKPNHIGRRAFLRRTSSGVLVVKRQVNRP